MHIFLSFSLAVLVACCGAQPQLWPQPQTVSLGSTNVRLCSKQEFGFVYSGKSTPSILENAFNRYKSIIFAGDASGGSATGGTGDGCLGAVTVSGDVTPLEFGMDESYSINISENSASIKAASAWGALRGLATFWQLVESDESGLSVWTATIADKPRFGHRGIMIDSARHFLPTATIKTILDAMEFDKFNVLHWHISDAQSFPLVVPDQPAAALGKGGSYAAQSGGKSPALQYSISDAQEVVAYAGARGIRVIPEFDIPGHAYSWGLGIPDIATNCPEYAHNINNIPLLASSNATYTVLESLFKQLREAFTDAELHLGGDEVVLGCWSEDPRIQAFMDQQGYSDISQVLQYFVSRADGLASALGWNITHWQDVFDDHIAVSLDAVMQVWRSKDDIGPILAWGNPVVVSNEDAWYLNCGFNPTCKYIPWETVYANDPLEGLSPAPSPAEAARLRGGEAVLFGEFADHTNAVPQLWPRASAVAERLWSAADVNDASTAEPRLHAQRCRLVSLGINASPVGPGFC